MRGARTPGNRRPPEFLQRLRALCDQHGILLIADEIQPGAGRTGTWFAHQHWNVVPDVVTLAKAIGGGIALGGVIAKPEVAEKLKPGTHAATFGGNPVACSAALATIATFEEENLLERATQVGERFRAHFAAMKAKTPLIQDIRIKGAMIGVQLSVDGGPIVEECLKRGLLINATHKTVIRLLPAVNIESQQIDDGCAILQDVLLAGGS